MNLFQFSLAGVGRFRRPGSESCRVNIAEADATHPPRGIKRPVPGHATVQEGFELHARIFLAPTSGFGKQHANHAFTRPVTRSPCRPSCWSDLRPASVIEILLIAPLIGTSSSAGSNGWYMSDRPDVDHDDTVVRSQVSLKFSFANASLRSVSYFAGRSRRFSVFCSGRYETTLRPIRLCVPVAIQMAAPPSFQGAGDGIPHERPSLAHPRGFGQCPVRVQHRFFEKLAVARLRPLIGCSIRPRRRPRISGRSYPESVALPAHPDTPHRRSSIPGTFLRSRRCSDVQHVTDS